MVTVLINSVIYYIIYTIETDRLYTLKHNIRYDTAKKNSTV